MSRLPGGSLRPGDRVGRYRIESLLGTGGMGEVYRARDDHLRRPVALKILPAVRLSEDRIQRFLAEARNASRLEHPAIATVHDTGRTQSNGSSIYFLAMELIEGETLLAPAARRDLVKTLDLMAQIAEGLAAAHANGMIHRDLKPENIIVSREGYAKILDFGIAKLMEADGHAGKDRTTDAATVFGTAAYMSPEQAGGADLDHRSDVFSFGTVLYEAVTGQSPFEGSTTVDTLHNILHRHPPIPEKLPAELRRILSKCLAKDRDERYHAMKDVAIDLRSLARQLRGGATEQTPTVVRLRTYVFALVAAVLIGGGWITRQRLAAGIASDVRSSVRMTRLTFSGNVGGGAISPDGNYIVYSSRERDRDSLWVKQLATGSLFRLAEETLAYFGRIRISPDGNYVYYERAARRDPNIWNIHQIPLLGGESRQVISDVDGSFTLSPDGKRMAFVRFNAVERVPKLIIIDLETGAERILLTRKQRFFGALSWAPDGKTIAFVSVPERRDGQRTIEQVRLDDGSTTNLLSNPFGYVGSIQWLPDSSGLIITAADHDELSQIWFLPYPSGPPRKITSDVVAYSDPSVTRDGKSVAAGRHDASSNLWIVEPGVRAPARPLTTGLANLFAMNGGPIWTRDGKILFTSFIGGRSHLSEIAAPQRDVQLAAADFGAGIRYLSRQQEVFAPEISPADSRLLFVSDSGGTDSIWISNRDGSAARELTRQGRAAFPSFFPDGDSIAYVGFTPEGQFAYRMSLVDGSVQQLTKNPTNNTHVSPDGEWLLCRYRQPEPGKPLWRTALVSLHSNTPIRFFELPRFGGGPKLEWFPDGKSFSFVDWKDGVANVWVQSIEGGEPRQVTFFDSGSIYGFGWSPDGSRLVISHGNPVSDGVLITNFR